MELRCGHKLHGVVVDDHIVEVKCSSKFCGASSEYAVRHRFNIQTGECTTERYKNPPRAPQPKGTMAP